MRTLDFSSRSAAPELMDTEDCGFETFRACLADLAFVNRATLAYRPTLSFLESVARSGHLPRDRPLEIVDVGSGYGDMLRRIGAWSRQRRIDVRLTGIDLNPWSAKAAEEATASDVPVVWRTMSIFDYRQQRPVDLVISSLFAHHLDDASLVRFLLWMENTASIGWFINDLHRHELPYRLFAAASRVMRLHRFVQHDGPVSIARAFVAADWHRLLAGADIPPENTQVEWWMPFRLCVSRTKPT